MTTTDNVTEIFCIQDEFCKNLDAELTKDLHIAPIDERYKRMRNRKGQMSKSEIMTILLYYLLVLSATSSTITSFSSRNIWQATSLRLFPTRVSWNSYPACSST